MNTEFEAHRSGFPGFLEGPFVLVAGRLQSEPDLALSAPKCLVLLRIWTAREQSRFDKEFSALSLAGAPGFPARRAALITN